jgi:RNA polymerase sigma-70 factor (ECF subfamily)
MQQPTSCSYGTMSVDSKVIERAQAGDKEAFGEIWAATTDELTKYVRQKISDPFLIEEVVANTYRKAMVAIVKTKPNLYLMAWLRTIARNLVIDSMRGDKEYSLEARSEHYQEELVAPEDEEHRDLAEVVQQMMAKLKPEQARAIKLQADGRSYLEIAQLMGREPRQIKGLLERGRKSARIIFRQLTGASSPDML